MSDIAYWILIHILWVHNSQHHYTQHEHPSVIMLSAAYFIVRLSVAMLNIIMKNVVASKPEQSQIL